MPNHSRSQVSRRTVLGSILALALTPTAGLVAACSGTAAARSSASTGAAVPVNSTSVATSGAATAHTTAPVAVSQASTIEYWQMLPGTHPEEVAIKAVLDDYTKRNTHGVTVRVGPSGGTNPTDLSKVLAAISGGTPPNMINTFNFTTSGLMDQGAAVDVDAELRGDTTWGQVRSGVYPQLLAALTWKGKLYAVPTYNSYFEMYYSKNALQRAGLTAPPPAAWTWQDFVHYCTAAAQPPKVTGYDCDWTYSYTGMVALNNGAPFVNADATKFLMDQPAFIASIEWQQSLVKNGLMRAYAAGVADGGYKERLPQAGVVFQYAVPARVPQYRQQKVDFGTCYYPLGPNNTRKGNATIGSTKGFTILKTKDAELVQASLQAALWASRPESGTTFAEIGGVPPSYRPIVESSAFQSRWQGDTELWPFFAALPGFQPYPNCPKYWSTRTLINQQLQAIWQGKASVHDALTQAQKVAQQQLDLSLQGK